MRSLLAGGILQLRGQVLRLLGQIDLRQKLLNRLCSHADLESLAILLPRLGILILSQNLLIGEVGISGIQHDVIREIEDTLQGSWRQIQHQPHA